ncbi:MAG: c-type cytochrome domain-containing protein, partial [Planctomycetaceae bacterium]
MNGCFCLLSTLIFFVVAGPTVADSARPESLREFLTKNCSDCHSGSDAEAGLNLESLPAEPADHAALKRWIRIFDRVHAGEMPPTEWGTVSASDQQKFLADTKSWLEKFQRRQWAEQGRVRGRRGQGSAGVEAA